MVKFELRKRDCTTQDKLVNGVIETWLGSQIIEDNCKKMVDSMLKRVNQVVLNKGGHTKY